MTAQRRTSDTPRSVPILIAALAAAGVGFAGLDARLFTRTHVAWLWLLPFVALLTAAGSLLVRFQYRDDVEALDVFEAVLVPVLFAFPGWAAVAMVALAKTLAESFDRVRPIKAAFNVAQWMAAVGAGAFVFSAIRHGPRLSGQDLTALLAAMVVVLVVNHLAVSSVVALTQGGALWDVLRGFRELIVPGWLLGGGLNLAFGLLFVAAYQWNPATMLLFVVPLLALHWASTAYAAARADERRIQALHRASAILSSVVDPLDAIDAFLEEVRACFEAESAEIVLVEDGKRLIRRVPAASTASSPVLTRSLLSLTEPARLTAQAAQPEGWRNCLAAPLIDDGATIGVLCTYNRTGLEGFEDGELSVLAALADDVLAALQRGALVQRVVDERRKLRDIVGGASDGIFSMSVHGAVTSWNPAMEDTTGYDAEAMVGRADFGLLRPRDAAGGDVLLERWPTFEGAPPPELEILTKSGERRWLSCSYSRATAPEGGGDSLVVIARDVTKVREVERLREDFVATVSHELRTPLSPIKGWASTLLQFGDSLEADDRRSAVQSILRQAQRLERLIVNLLEVSQIEHGALDAADAEVDLEAVVRRVVDDFVAASPERALNIRVTGQPVARAKELWIEQILTNLVSNAVKYSPDTESVEVTVRRRHDRVQVVVADQGCGIPSHELDRVFERFHRVREATTQTGTGLGLYIARQLAQQMEGTIAVESVPGRGSTFTLDLPAARRLVDVRTAAEVIGLEAS